MSTPIILWFRQDLRLADHPALNAAVREDRSVIPVYIHDEDAAGQWSPGGASAWWLHHSLSSLSESIASKGGELCLRRGDTLATLKELCAETGATEIYCTRRYEPWAADQEKSLHESLKSEDIVLKRYSGSLLFEPGELLTQGGSPFKVFTPFWRAAQTKTIAEPLKVPKVDWSNAKNSDELEDWSLLPQKPNWAEGWEQFWTPGEAGASEQLQNFVDDAISDYSDARDIPSRPATSRLSPHLHLGELSPRQVWHVAEQQRRNPSIPQAAISKFQAELGWREFSYHLLHFFPHIPTDSFKEQFAGFPWVTNSEQLERWQKGQTGYPIVDAGMRELWQTGFMHNRVRMVVASFLCKHLRIHWKEGEAWFWDTLVDADLASNGCSWQWVAGSGADAAPYFRIFNPVAQGEKFDGEGEYVRRWVPELAKMPNKFIHAPWIAPKEILTAAGVDLGTDYPEPLVDHKEARQAALDAYETVKLRAAS